MASLPKCIHVNKGQCERCREEIAADLDGWLMFGDHPEGVARYRQMMEDIAEDAHWTTVRFPLERGVLDSIDADALAGGEENLVECPF